MRYTIVGRNIEVTPGLKKAVEEKIGKLEFRLSRLQAEAPPQKRKMGVEITHGRQGTEKVQGKHTDSHWTNWQRAKPMERHAVQRYGVGPA